MKIIVDACGGDNAPLEVIKGCTEAVVQYGVDILLVGPKEQIKELCNEHGMLLYRIEVEDVSDYISMEDETSEIMKSKSGSTMAHGLRLLAAGAGDAFVSAGNSGALVMGATFIVKRIRGIKRCAFAPVMPKDKGCFMLIDGGANVECRPAMLKQFGVMGSIYMNKVMRVKTPKVGLVNVGVEEHKGGEFQHEAYQELKNSGLNFVGNIEARDIPMDGADVVVTDGFTGNIILKLYEGMAVMMMDKIKGVLTKNAKTKLAGAMITPEMRNLKGEIDYNEYGGAPIIGIAKPVFKVHGNAKAKAFKNAIRLTIDYVKADVVGEIEKSISVDLEN